MDIKKFKFLKTTNQNSRWVLVYFYPLTFAVLTDMEEQRINYFCSWIAQQYPTSTYENYILSIRRDLDSIFDDVQYRRIEYTGKTRQ